MSESEPTDLDWVQLRQEMSKHHTETTREKLGRKLNENPFVPIGKYYVCI